VDPLQAARLRQEIQRWISPPGGDRSGRIAGRQISRLLWALDDANPRDDLMLSALAEAQCARHLLACGCTLQFEFPTASGRHADFRVEREGVVFYLHIKRLWTGRPRLADLPAALAAIERLPRPVSIAVRWCEHASAAALATIERQVSEFALQASAGDEHIVRDAEGAWLASARILAPTLGTHATVRSDEGDADAAAVTRAQRLLRRAFGQFMPGSPNVVWVVGDGPASAAALETALLGTVVERWDRFPPRGHRVAHGRADDGFWTRGQYAGCDLVAWLPMTDGEPPRLWRREEAQAAPGVDRIVHDALALGDPGYSSPTA
jgi:hypothetical protein